MPTYAYRCQSCSHRFELSQHVGDVPVQDCPRCRARVRRVLVPAGILLRNETLLNAEAWRGPTQKPKKTEVDA
jgi:putative FmdB family regulatory protein